MKVLKENRERENNFVIIADDSIETKNLCECYDEYGIQVGCDAAGCYTREDDAWKDSDEEMHIQVDVYEYHDGHNWRSLLVGGNLLGEADLEEVDSDLEDEILKAYEDADWRDWNQGICEGETEKYKFIKSQWQGCFAIADVIVK